MAIKIKKRKSAKKSSDTDEKRSSKESSEDDDHLDADESGDEGVVDATFDDDEDEDDRGDDEDDRGLLADEELAEPDRFVEASVGFSGWLQDNWKVVAGVLGVVLAGIVGYLIYDHMNTSTEIAHSTALNEALAAYTTLTQSEVDEIEQAQMFLAIRNGMSPDELPPLNLTASFADEAQRDQAVLERAQAAATNYPDSLVAAEATLVAAGAALRLGNTDEAQQLASEAEAGLSEDAKVFALQLRAVAQADAGSLDEAIGTYESINSLGGADYGAFALMQIGLLSEQTGDTDKAADAYAEIAGDYPDSPMFEDANRRLSLLVDDAEARIQKVTGD